MDQMDGEPVVYIVQTQKLKIFKNTYLVNNVKQKHVEMLSYFI